MKWPAHRDLVVHLERGAPVYLPVNPVEYHGPHLSLFNDHLISRGLAAGLHERLCESLGDHPLLFAEDVGVGVDPCPGPGSRATPYSVVRRLVVDAVERLADLGATRVVLISFHGSPLHSHALQAGVDALRRRGVAALAPLNLALERLASGAIESVRDAWLPVTDEATRAALIADVASDFHAGFVETSLSLHYAPETVDGHTALPPCPPPTPAEPAATLARWARSAGLDRLGLDLELVSRGLGWHAMRPFPGYTGRPDLANPESGRIFARGVLDGFAEATLGVFAGEAIPPPPMLSWLPAVTLGGRVGSLTIPNSAIGLPAPSERAIA